MFEVGLESIILSRSPCINRKLCDLGILFPDGGCVDEFEPGHGYGALHRHQDGVDRALYVGETDDGRRSGLWLRVQLDRGPRYEAQGTFAAQE